MCCGVEYPSAKHLQTHHSTSTEHYQTFCQKCKKNFQNSNNLREHLKVHMPKDLNCWGCGSKKRFATISAMLIHLESGICTAGWRIHHINTLAALASHSKAFIISGKAPWLRAGAPPRYTKDAHYDAKRGPGVWVCPTCDAVFANRPLLYNHLQNQVCCQGYPEVLKCPVCPDRFTTISGMLQHIETPPCPASKDTESISHLLEKLQTRLANPASQAKLCEIHYKLAPDPDRPNKLLVKVIDTSGDDDTEGVAVVQTGLATVSIAP